jgi:alpha-glucosidase (family GH31 glycosyl hydrolase)
LAFWLFIVSILPIGPPLLYANEKLADPIELRIYPGADGEFTIYEDENDNYDYEKSAYALIPIHWDDANRKLTVGERTGKFPGMLDRRSFHGPVCCVNFRLRRASISKDRFARPLRRSGN